MIAQWIGSHLGATIGAAVAASSFLTAAAFKFLESRIPAIVKSDTEELLDYAMGKLTRPEDKAALKAVLTAIRARFPDAGGAWSAVAADALIKEIPALAPYREDLIKIQVAIEQAAEQAIDDEEKK